MDLEFRDLYNKELERLYEEAREFGEEYPGIAERLGGLVRERMDPMVSGLLEGTAFLAARVQLKIRHEFPEFSVNLLEQLVPNYLAPTPSAILARVAPPFGDPALRDGRVVPAGAPIDATYLQRGKRIACRYTLSSPITLFPFEIDEARYFASPAPMQALGAPIDSHVLAGLQIGVTLRSKGRPEDEPPDAEVREKPETWFAGCRVASLPFHLIGPEPDAHLVYEQLFSRCRGVYLRYLDPFGDPVVRDLGVENLHQIGLDESEPLFPADDRQFHGFNLLREYFMFPRKFLGFELGGLDRLLGEVKARRIELLFTFDEVNPRLASAVEPRGFALFAAPALNLFELTTDRVALRSNTHEYHVVADRSRNLELEPHRLLEVFAHVPGGREKVPVRPLYSASLTEASDSGLYFTTRRMPRRRSAEEKAMGSVSDYTGTDLFISLVGPADRLAEDGVAELGIRALCSNRHLAEQLPVGEGGADFRWPEDVTLDIHCVAGPTRPREPLTSYVRSRGETLHTGTVTWRLINLLSLNHLGLVERAGGRDGRTLRETLALFADLADSAQERRVRGVRRVESRPAVRRIRHRTGIGAARGTEISVTLDEKSFEGSGAFLLGAILDRFFAEYAGVNHFTQTVIRTPERGEIKRWPARAGRRRVL